MAGKSDHFLKWHRIQSKVKVERATFTKKATHVQLDESNVKVVPVVLLMNDELGDRGSQSFGLDHAKRDILGSHYDLVGRQRGGVPSGEPFI